ncbi:hypothetical protein [Streptomyces decoyicus]|uniref:hypothetical protein n=1 Tax=Streptomyces decoyicus TaxID=249567 RepID=UPI000B131410|nr:hypothetical protein [Streptomyces decoyicus]QZY17219.1 hypothetical protein K7C20_19770 [Streptomyces decoyicus]
MKSISSGAIGGAGALTVGRHVSEDVVKGAAGKAVVAGATGCLSSLSCGLREF